MAMKNSLKGALVGFTLLASGFALAGDGAVNCPAGTKKVGGPSSAMQVTTCVNAKGDFHGPYVAYDEAGRVTARGTVKNGMRDGLFTFYDADGTVNGETQFREGDYDGKRVEYFANGKPKLVENYVKGSREGLQQRFSQDGKVQISAEYKADRKVASVK